MNYHVSAIRFENHGLVCLRSLRKMYCTNKRHAIVADVFGQSRIYLAMVKDEFLGIVSLIGMFAMTNSSNVEISLKNRFTVSFTKVIFAKNTFTVLSIPRNLEYWSIEIGSSRRIDIELLKAFGLTFLECSQMFSLNMIDIFHSRGRLPVMCYQLFRLRCLEDIK